MHPVATEVLERIRTRSQESRAAYLEDMAAVRPEGLAGRGQQVHFPTMRSGGLDAAFLIVFVGQGPRDEAGNAKALADAMQKFASIHRVVANHPDEIGFARTADARGGAVGAARAGIPGHAWP